MGEVRSHRPALRLLSAFSRHEESLDWAVARAALECGAVAFRSRAFEFTETEYYSSTMGDGLVKQFFAFERLIDPGELASIKRQTNGWEVEYAARHHHAEPRPLNLDPGYITPAKLVLASTKDFAHRIYLGQGIYAEVTLQYKHGAWQPLPWTFPDYRRADYHEFFTFCRDYLRQRLREQKSALP
jgi:hypothetical protein